MKFNSDAAIAQARKDRRHYGSWFDLIAATTRRDDGIRVLPRYEAGAAPAAGALGLDRKLKP